MIPSMDATKAINFHRKEALVVATSSALREWNDVSERRNLDIDLTDCMDRAPAVGLGLAIAQPNRKVLVLDCDATLRTDLGSLATVGQSETENLVHFVFDDANKSSTDGLAIRGADNVNLLAMAEVQALPDPMILYGGAVPPLDSAGATAEKLNLPQLTTSGVGDAYLARLSDPVLGRSIEIRYRAVPVGDDLQERAEAGE